MANHDSAKKRIRRNARMEIVNKVRKNRVRSFIKKVEIAIRDLEFSEKRITKDIKKTINSAVANAENNFQYDIDKLVVKEAYCGKKITMKRFRPRARGRVNQILKRTSHLNQDQENLTFNEIKINTIQKKAFRGDRRLNLGPTEFNILFFLLKNKQRVFSREQILNKIWPNQVNVELRTVDVHIRRLRKELNQNKDKDLIRTVRSAGYSLDFDE